MYELGASADVNDPSCAEQVAELIASKVTQENGTPGHHGALDSLVTSTTSDAEDDDDDDDDNKDGRPVLGAFQPPLLATGQAESSDDDDDEASRPRQSSPPPLSAPADALAASSAADEPDEPGLLPSADDALEDDAAGSFLRVSHSVDVPAMEGFADPSDAAAASKLSGAEKQRVYTENAAACLAARNQAPSANRKRKPGSEGVDGGHFRSEANGRKNAGKAKGEFKKRPERSREH